MAEMIGEVATTTITKDKNSVTVAWPDLVGAYDAYNTEISLWKRESEAKLYYHRLLTSGSGKPRVPWWKIITLVIIAIVLALIIHHWMTIAIIAIVFTLALSATVYFSMRTFSPLVEGLGSPSLVVKALEADISTLALVREYLTTTTVQDKANLADALREITNALHKRCDGNGESREK